MKSAKITRYMVGHVLRLLSDYVVRMETMDPSVAKLNQTLLNYRNCQNRLEKMSTRPSSLCSQYMTCTQLTCMLSTFHVHLICIHACIVSTVIHTFSCCIMFVMVGYYFE